MSLPDDPKSRESWPIYDYIYGYFPDALMAEVQVSWVGNQQHNPGEKMHWAREKSKDHMNKALRHIDDYARGNKKDTDGTWHLAKAIWRLKARLQLDIEAERAAKSAATTDTPWDGSREEERRARAERDAKPGQVFPGPTTGGDEADMQKALDEYRKLGEREPWRRGGDPWDGMRPPVVTFPHFLPDERPNYDRTPHY